MTHENHGPTIQEWQRTIADHYGHGWLAGAESSAQTAERQRDALLAALILVVDAFGSWHDDDCPGDDTCSCSAKPVHDAVNAAISNVREQR